MARLLVAYSSRYGQAAKIAEHVAGLAGRRGHQVAVMDVASEPAGLYVEDHDAVILGASIHVARHETAATRFVQRYGGFLARVPSAFYSVSLAASGRTPEDAKAAQDYVDAFLGATGWTPASTATFGGALPYSRYGFVVRLLMKRIARSHGLDTDRDLELTDWQAVEAFTDRFLDGLVAHERARRVNRGEARPAAR